MGSTTGAVVAVLQNITEMLEENDHVIVISMDYTKAFDSIRHEAITQPLSILEMPDSIYNWLVRYHEDRRHVTIFNGCSSKVDIINASVVQGSVLGPSEYILGTADLHPVSDKNRLLKYADDFYLLIGSWNIATAKHEIQNITSWAKSNVNKTREMAIFRKNKASLATQPSVTGTTRVTSMKILGITVTEKLSVSAHISSILGSCSSSIYALKTLRSRDLLARALLGGPKATMLARPTYASPAWWGYLMAENRDRV